MVGRTELERRGTYMQQVINQLKEGNPLIEMIQCCLKNHTKERPSIQQVIEWLEQARAEVNAAESAYDVDKLSLVQLLQTKEKHIEQQQQLLNAQNEKVKLLEQKIESLEQQLLQPALQEVKIPVNHND